MTQKKRWPSGAEEARTEAIESAKAAQELVKVARANLKRNVDVSELALSDINYWLEHIQNLLVVAKQGKGGENSQ